MTSIDNAVMIGFLIALGLNWLQRHFTKIGSSRGFLFTRWGSYFGMLYLLLVPLAVLSLFDVWPLNGLVVAGVGLCTVDNVVEIIWRHGRWRRLEHGQ